MFLYSAWCSLSLPTRIAIAERFGIQKRGSTEVFDNAIKSDGYLIKEIEEALNVDALQKFLETEETDMQVLWTRLIEKIENPDAYAANYPVVKATVQEDIGTNTTEGATIEFTPKKRGRPKKKE